MQEELVALRPVVSGETLETALGQALSTSGSLTSAPGDVDTLREVLSGDVITSLMDVPWTPIFLAMCSYFHPLIGLVAWSARSSS